MVSWWEEDIQDMSYRTGMKAGCSAAAAALCMWSEIRAVVVLCQHSVEMCRGSGEGPTGDKSEAWPQQPSWEQEN